MEKEGFAKGFVDRVASPSKPSLFGNNVASFSVELSPEGATLFWNALGGPVENGESNESGIVSVYYDLWFSARLPPATVKVTFSSSQLRSFVKDIDRNIWGQAVRETVRKDWRQSQNGNIEIKFASGNEDPETEAMLREWALKTMDEFVARQLNVDMNELEKKFTENPDRLQAELSNVSDFSNTYKESRAVEHTLSPQATLQNINAMKDENGNTLIQDIRKYFREVDLNDAYFKQVRVGVDVNADYKDLSIYNVLVDLKYAGKRMVNTDPEAKVKEGLVFSSENQGAEYMAAYKEGDSQEVTYSYKVNFKGESKVFQSEAKTTDDGHITIGVDDTGVLKINGSAKGVDFDYVKSAQVSIRYRDQGRNVSVPEKQFLLDKNNTEFSVVEPIFAPRDQPFEYKVLYRMKDDTEFTQDWQPYQANDFYLNDPFTDTKTYSIRGVGSFKTIEAIFLDLSYTGDRHGYRQSKKQTLDSQNRSYEWKLPVIDPDKGQVTYSGYIQYEDGNTEDIPTQVATSSSIRVGRIREGVLETEVSTEGIDFDARVERAKITLVYADQKKTFKFREEDTEDWEVDQKDKDDASYEWQAEVHMHNRDFGDAGKIYLPLSNLAKGAWGEEAGDFSLKDYLPSDESLARHSNLLMVQVFSKGIDWRKVKRTSVIFEYVNKAGRFKNWEESDWEKSKKMSFLAPLDKQDGEASRRYRWRAEFRLQDGQRVYYPGPDKRAMAESDLAILFINDYLPEEHGGDL